MEFKFRDGENRSTTTLSPLQRPLSTVPLVSGHPLRGGFSTIIPSPRVYPTSVPINAEEAIRREMVKEQIRRELQKEEIRREILASEMAWRRDLEEEVRRELASERALRMPIQRIEEVTFGERVSLSMNPEMRLNNPVNNNNICGGPQPQLAPKVDITQFYKQMPNETLTNKDKIMILAKPNAAKCKEVLDVNLGGAKRKLVTPFPVDDNDAGSSLQKKPKKEWSCAVCLIVTTSEKALNDHLQGKKHKVKAASLTTQKMGLDARQDGETLGSGMSPADKGKLELIKKDLAVQKSHDLGGIDTENEAENEATTEKEVCKTNALTRKKFKFYCAFCQVRTHSEIVMQSHKSGKKHLANIAKLSPNNSAGAAAGRAAAAANSE